MFGWGWDGACQCFLSRGGMGWGGVGYVSIFCVGIYPLQLFNFSLH